jgi:hypothetical protein
MNLASATRLALLLLLAARLDAADLPPLIQNARVTVWDVPACAPRFGRM